MRRTAISKLDGNLSGIKPSQRKYLERTFRRKVDPQDVVSPELARHLTKIARELGRQVGVFLSRNGGVENVIVGDANQLMLPDVGRLRGGSGRFRGLRLVHTHLRGEGLTHDDLNDLALLRLDMVAVVQAEKSGEPGAVELAYLDPAAVAEDEGDSEAKSEDDAGRGAGSDKSDKSDKSHQRRQNKQKGRGKRGQQAGDGGRDPFLRVQARDVWSIELDFKETIEALEEEFARLAGRSARSNKERALVISVVADEEHYEETLELVRSAGVEIAGTVRQKRREIHPKTVVGQGKLQDIILESMRRRADVAIFDINLKPGQARSFEDATGLKAIDRTQLILDVFAQRARSRDGKLQVELAQLKYSLPRLTSKDEGLSRLAGGIGGRGPGETVLEIGRRRINDRIRRLEGEIDQLSKQRELRRRRRREATLPILSIVGYTNAGKSTLLNALTGSEVTAKNRLFDTLDPTSRRLRFPREGEVVLTDTVGFMSDLPKDLVAAFRATLEELADADLLLHVVDGADERLASKHHAVVKLLEDLDLGEIPRLVVINKADLLSDEAKRDLEERYEGVALSARERTGLRTLIRRAEDFLSTQQQIWEESAAASENAEPEPDGGVAASSIDSSDPADPADPADPTDLNTIPMSSELVN